MASARKLTEAFSPGSTVPSPLMVRGEETRWRFQPSRS